MTNVKITMSVVKIENETASFHLMDKRFIEPLL
jgi:hypothetical protein